MNVKQLEDKFAQALKQQLETAEKECGKGCPQLVAKSEKIGAADAVKDMLKRGNQSENFAELEKNKNLKLSVEALVTRSEFGELFTDAQVDACFAALCDCGYYG